MTIATGIKLLKTSAQNGNRSQGNGNESKKRDIQRYVMMIGAMVSVVGFFTLWMWRWNIASSHDMTAGDITLLIILPIVMCLCVAPGVWAGCLYKNPENHSSVKLESKLREKHFMYPESENDIENNMMKLLDDKKIIKPRDDVKANGSVGCKKKTHQKGPMFKLAAI